MSGTAANDDALLRARSYDDVADWYERVNAPLMFDAPARALVECAELEPGSRVLDVGSGTGAVARAVRDFCGDGMSVTAIDPSFNMLMAARRGGVLDAVLGALPQLPFSDQSFDAALSAFVMTHVDDPDAAARDLRRVLRPGGCLALSAWAPADDVYARAWAEVVSEFVAADRVSDAAQRVLPGESRFSARDGLSELLGASEFQAVRSETRSFTFNLTVTEMIKSREVCATGRALRALLSDEEWEAYRARAREVLGARFPDGVRYEREVFIAVARK
jgi:ubiquinone/menaquinone biosynthesis C-methylase UbiE